MSTRIGLIGHGSAARAAEPATVATTTLPVAASNLLLVNLLSIGALPGVRALIADKMAARNGSGKSCHEKASACSQLSSPAKAGEPVFQRYQ
jgi:hypothetical protein